MEKQAYKFELPKKWRIYNVFYVSLLDKNTSRKRWVDKNMTEFEAGGNEEEYKVEGIWNSVVYEKELAADHLLGIYYLISWEGYPKKENT